MIPVIVKWVEGAPVEFKPGQFVVYEDGDCMLIGCNCIPHSRKITKHTTLVEPHELDWLQSMGVERSLGAKA